MSIRAALIEVLQQDRPVFGANDGQGGTPRSFTPIATIRGRVSGGSADERERGGRPEAFYRHTLFAESGTDIQRGDKMTREDGTSFVVIAVRHLSGRRPHVECQVEELKAGR